MRKQPTHRPLRRRLHDPAEDHDAGEADRGQGGEFRARQFERGDGGPHHLDHGRVLIELSRQRRNRSTVFGMPAVADFAILVGTALQLAQPLVSLKNFTLPVTLTCLPRIGYEGLLFGDLPSPHCETSNGTASPTSDTR
jgi:hypothetical protein